MKKLFPIIFVFLFLFAADVFSQTVYITKSGKKYHKENCRYLSNSMFAIELSVVAERGYTPCKVCKPVSSGIEVEDESVQCRAMTRKKTQCKRYTKYENGLCWQHQGK